METQNHIKNVYYLDVRGSGEETSKKLGGLSRGSCDAVEQTKFSTDLVKLASPEKFDIKYKDFLGDSELDYKVAGFADSFSGEDSILLMRNLSELLKDLGIEIDFLEDHGILGIPGHKQVRFALDGTILESGNSQVLGLNAFHYLLCFLDQDFAAVIEKDGEMQYVCDVSCFEKTPKNSDGTNRMLGANFLDFHSKAPNFGGELSEALPKLLDSFRDGTLDVLVVDLYGQNTYELQDGHCVRRFERDKFLPLFDQSGTFKGFFGLADVYMQDTDISHSPFEGGLFHSEIQTQTDLLRNSFREKALRQSAHPALLLSEEDCDRKIQIVRALLEDKDAFYEEAIALASELNSREFGAKLELYGISYVSDLCINDCKYCGHNAKIHRGRSTLNEDEMAQDFEAVLSHSPDEFCILAGERPKLKDLVVKAVRVLCASNEKMGSPLKRISLNVAPMDELDLKEIVAANTSGLPIQFRVFQESYDRGVYEKMHTRGPKSDYNFRVTAQERALSAGFDAVGVGSLLGINADSDNEIVALIEHSLLLKKRFGQDPYSLSIPRHQAVKGYDFQTPGPVDDKTYVYYHAILRLALPEVRLMITSRESEDMIRKIEPFINIRDLAPRPGVGGNMRDSVFQNELGDPRSAEEIISDLLARGKR